MHMLHRASLALWFTAAAIPAQATDLLFAPMSPNFGGNSAIAFQMAQFQKGLRDAKAAADAAAAKAATPVDPSQQFANAIISQLNGLVAREIAQRIANSQPGQAGTIQSGNVTVTFVNADGQLNVIITTPTGTTSLSVPSGS